jgi:hypothetical protein
MNFILNQWFVLKVGKVNGRGAIVNRRIHKLLPFLEIVFCFSNSENLSLIKK